MDDPTPFGRYLGCEHITCERVSPITGKRVRVLEYDMSEFMDQRVEVHCQQFDVVKSQLSKRKVGKPFADVAQKFVLERGGHCTRCGAQCCS
eukprot:1851372-Alexandrium_andersonii.AAC.1